MADTDDVGLNELPARLESAEAVADAAANIALETAVNSVTHEEFRECLSKLDALAQKVEALTNAPPATQVTVQMTQEAAEASTPSSETTAAEALEVVEEMTPPPPPSPETAPALVEEDGAAVVEMDPPPLSKSVQAMTGWRRALFGKPRRRS